MDAGALGELQECLHDRALEVAVGRVAWGADAADRALEQRVAGEYIGPVDQQRDHPRGMAGSVQRLDLQRATLDRLARQEVPRRGGDIAALQRMDQNRGLRMEIGHARELGYVVVVM